MSGAEAVNAVAKAGVVPLGTASLPDPQQLELLRRPDGSLPVGAIHMVRGRGRPPGARNKRSKKIADYYVQRYGDPIDALGQLANTPLRQLIEVLMEADGSAEREARLLEGVEQALDHLKSLRTVPGANIVEVAGQLGDAIDKLALAASRISGKPGKLALDALALQVSAHVKALEYVHGKQPISIDIQGKADLVVFAPELLKQYGIDPAELQAEVAKRGLEAFDPENMRLLPSGSDGNGAEDGDFEPVEPDGEGE